jgi:Sulfotransferase family
MQPPTDSATSRLAVSRWTALAAPPVFILGATRSGTTWLFDILTSHPEVAGVSESFLFVTPGLGSLFGPMHSSLEGVGVGRLLSREELLAEVRRFSERLLGRAIGPGHRFIVEKSGAHIWAAALIRDIFPDARFVNVVRDGRDVCVSVLAATASWAPGWKKSFGADLQQAALEWRTYVEVADECRDLLGESFLSISYEELHSDPFGGSRRLFDFCGIPVNDSMVKATVEATDFAANYTPNERGFRRGGRVGDWRQAFTSEDRLVFDRAAGPALIALGYERDNSWVGDDPD